MGRRHADPISRLVHHRCSARRGSRCGVRDTRTVPHTGRVDDLSVCPARLRGRASRTPVVLRAHNSGPDAGHLLRGSGTWHGRTSSHHGRDCRHDHAEKRVRAVVGPERTRGESQVHGGRVRRLRLDHRGSRCGLPCRRPGLGDTHRAERGDLRVTHGVLRCCGRRVVRVRADVQRPLRLAARARRECVERGRARRCPDQASQPGHGHRPPEPTVHRRAPERWPVCRAVHRHQQLQVRERQPRASGWRPAVDPYRRAADARGPLTGHGDASARVGSGSFRRRRVRADPRSSHRSRGSRSCGRPNPRGHGRAVHARRPAGDGAVQHRHQHQRQAGPSRWYRGPPQRSGHGHVPRQVRRPRQLRDLRRVDARAGTAPLDARERPAGSAGIESDPGALSAHRQPFDRVNHGLRGARTLDPPRTGSHPAGHVHSDRGRNGSHRSGRSADARAGRRDAGADEPVARW